MFARVCIASHEILCGWSIVSTYAMSYLFVVLLFALHSRRGLGSSADYLTPRFAYYADMLKDLETQQYSSDMYSSCTYYDVCNAEDMSKVILTNQSELFPEGFWVNTSLVGVKSVAGADPNNDINNICFGMHISSEWERYLVEDAYDALSWQYLGTTVEGSFIYHPISNYTAGCPGTYDPRRRPWYLSAVTGPLNLVLMIDISGGVDAITRVTKAVEIGLDLLDTLSLWSFFNIGTYSSSSVMWASSLLRASRENVEAGRVYLRQLRVSNSSFVAVGDSLVVALESLDNSRATGSTSLCHDVIVYLGGTRNDFASGNVGSILSDFGSNIIIFSYVLNFLDVAASTSIYRDMACLNNGLYVVLTSTSKSSIAQVTQSFISYFGSALDNRKVRFSEIYWDNLGMGDILTGVKTLYTSALHEGYDIPIVAGVFGVDLMISEMDNEGTISHDDIHSFLGSSLECPALRASSEVLDYLRGEEETSRCLAVSTSNVYTGGGELFLDRNKAGYETAAAFGFLGTLALLLFAFQYMDGRQMSTKPIAFFSLTITLLIFIPCGIALLVYILVTHWDETVIVYNWRSAEMTVLETYIDESRCCRITGCLCSSVGSDVDSCTFNKFHLIAGQCNNGYYCCRQSCYECNCRRDIDGREDCDSCCICEADVSRQRCYTECDTCYKGVVTWQYSPKEEPDLNVMLQYRKSCKFSLSGCATDLVNKYTVGSKYMIYYDPTDYTKTSDTSEYPGSYMKVITALACLLSLPVLWLILRAFYKYCLVPSSVEDAKVAPDEPVVSGQVLSQGPVVPGHHVRRPVQSLEAPHVVQGHVVSVHHQQAQSPHYHQSHQPQQMQEHSSHETPSRRTVSPVSHHQQPVYHQTANQQPVYQQPVNQQHVYQQPVYLQPGNRQPVYQQPMHQQPVNQQPMYHQPMYQQPMYQQPGNQQSMFQQPVNQQPMFQQSVNQQPIYQQPGNQQSMYQQPVNQQPMFQQPVNQQPMYQQPDNRPVVNRQPVNQPVHNEQVPVPMPLQPGK